MSESRIGRKGQIKIYTGKCFRTFFHEKGWKSLVSTFIIAVILSWVIGDNTFKILENTKTGIFAMICGCLWIGLFNSIQSVCRERAIIKREHRTGLHISSYVIAHMVFEFVLCVVEAVILTVVFAFFREFPSSGVIFQWITLEFFISFVLIIFAADTLGLLVSCIVKTENAAMTVMPFILIIQLVMSGMLFSLPDSAVAVKELTVSKWGLSAICNSSDINDLPSRQEIELLDLAKEFGYSEEEAEEYIEEYVDKGDDEFDGTPENVTTAWLVLAAYSVLYGVIGMIALKFVDKDKR